MTALYIIGGLIVLILLVAAIVGTGWKFEKSILIQAPASKAWEYVSTLKAMIDWNPWIGKDPNIKQEITGTDGTIGATYSWESQDKNVGAGNQTLVKIVPQSEVDSRINFIRPFKGVGDAYIRLTAEGGATRATWGIVSSTPYPMNILKVFGVIEKNMDKAFGEGLNKLKTLSEK